ncbi:calcyclin-binding protein-like [Mercenaria mercenaria]|uniref:calcyclin-binding protein-like n=1 Tax=Mercenaria mercenaria TaxID=6596 RepID=UPI00234EA8C6|nr:calcyclin-binding protein-like [Mercenaria mercenaria]
MAQTNELRLDADELRKLVDAAERQRVKDILTIELRKLETEISLKEDAAKQSEMSQSTPQPVKPSVSQTRIPTVDIKNYAWDQSEKFMKIYATVAGVETVPKEQVTCTFNSRSFSLRCNSVNNKNYTCEVTTLMEDILPDDSYFKIKTDTVLIMLKKKETGKTWPYVTQTEKKLKDKPTKPPIDKEGDPNDSMMALMKQMYDEGDDEMKRTIAKAWTESREKKGDMAL